MRAAERKKTYEINLLLKVTRHFRNSTLKRSASEIDGKAISA